MLIVFDLKALSWEKGKSMEDDNDKTKKVWGWAET